MVRQMQRQRIHWLVALLAKRVSAMPRHMPTARTEGVDEGALDLRASAKGEMRL